MKKNPDRDIYTKIQAFTMLAKKYENAWYALIFRGAPPIFSHNLQTVAEMQSA